MWLYYNIFSLIINTISIPYDKGANVLGSASAPNILFNDLNKILPIESNKIINTNQIMIKMFYDTYFEIVKQTKNNNIPIILGGDHSIVVPGIFAINQYYKNIENKKLGILWCDAHADFNTLESSPSNNLHGMPVSILCHHTLEYLAIDDAILPEQFGFYGVRDIDSLEFDRFKKYNMKILENNNIDNWLCKFDKIHVSFDIDCIEPTEFNGVNTPVPNGKTINNIKNLFKKIKKTNKLISMDIVEYNPYANNNVSIITDIVKNIF